MSQTVQAGPLSLTLNPGLFIDGQFVDSKSGKTFPSVNPATGAVICQVAEAGSADIDLAVDAAKRAYKTWGKIPSRSRAEMMWKLVAGLQKYSAELAHLEALDNGKTLKDSSAVDIPMTIQTFQLYASMADKLEGKTYETEALDFSYTRREPIGVCAAIIPWNFPLLMLAWKVAPCLACGNTMVLKSSEKTPLSALFFAKICQEVGLPAGVLNIVSGFGPEAGSPLAAHMDVHKIAFTGSAPTGKKVMALAAESNLKKVTLELGGKSPNIIFDDADLDVAVKWATMGIYFNHGQVCCAGSRIYVQEGIYDEFIKRFVAHTASIKVGDQFDDSTNQGPQVDDLQLQRILGFMDTARQEGVTVQCGGKRMGDKGYYMAPTLFTDVKETSRLVQDEIFGPVAVALKFKTEAEVIERANDTRYGLAAAVFTTNLSRAIRVEKALEAGTVWVNCFNAFDVRVPFGGFKESGFGREMSTYALDNYTQIKAVRIALSKE
eukprot:NODE_1065_length_1677_cov_80.633548_g1000_i0.p1 GENE.NODE_1065_length_1677_cov_80.633548_g1000_i0~~NODE_1065_length_1677_cov_80.633548_g1000_i0.p1  ORF type:complete len:505 (+),score=89.20 NODE_1065_length_1677_cov_80.633548_g1000_i0:42-1517(+)